MMNLYVYMMLYYPYQWFVLFVLILYKIQHVLYSDILKSKIHPRKFSISAYIFSLFLQTFIVFAKGYLMSYTLTYCYLQSQPYYDFSVIDFFLCDCSHLLPIHPLVCVCLFIFLQYIFYYIQYILLVYIFLQSCRIRTFI